MMIHQFAKCGTWDSDKALSGTVLTRFENEPELSTQDAKYEMVLEIIGNGKGNNKIIKDVKLVLQPLKGIVKKGEEITTEINEIYAGKYPASKSVAATDRRTVSFGDLVEGEKRKVLANLSLPKVSKEVHIDSLQIYCEYSDGKTNKTNPFIFRVKRYNNPDPKKSEAHAKQVEIAKSELLVQNNVVKYGPYGSQLQETNRCILKEGEFVKEIIIRSAWIVDAIGFVVQQPNGSTITYMFGGKRGIEDQITLRSGEYVTRLSGVYGRYQPNHVEKVECVIAKLMVHTNLYPKGYGPYGEAKKTVNRFPFSTPTVTKGPLVGFFGRQNNFLESIGVFIKEMQVLKDGPYGSQSLENYGFVLRDGEVVREVKLRHGWIVDAIGFVIEQPSGIRSTTDTFGGMLGEESSKVTLKKDEYITKLSGVHGYYESKRVIAKLLIHTNFKPEGYGPFGESKGTSNQTRFTTQFSTKGPIVGFFGRHSNYLESIGLYIKQN